MKLETTKCYQSQLKEKLNELFGQPNAQIGISSMNTICQTMYTFQGTILITLLFQANVLCCTLGQLSFPNETWPLQSQGKVLIESEYSLYYLKICRGRTAQRRIEMIACILLQKCFSFGINRRLAKLKLLLLTRGKLRNIFYRLRL